MALRSQLHAIATEDDVGLRVAISLVVHRLIARRREEGDLDIPIARVFDAVVARHGVKFVVRGPERHRFIVGFGRHGVFDDQLSFAFDDGRLLPVIGGCGRHDDLVGAHREWAFVVNAEIEVVARGFRELVARLDVDRLRVAHAVFTFDREAIGAKPVFRIELACIVDAGRGEGRLIRPGRRVGGAPDGQYVSAQGAHGEKRILEVHSGTFVAPSAGLANDPAYEIRKNTR